MEPVSMSVSTAILVARLILGLSIASHGAQKLFGAFEGPGLAGATGMMESLGFRPARLFALMASATEIGAGLLLVFGLGGPIAPALVIMVMIVGATTVHLKNGFFAAKGGCELNLFYGAVALLLAFTGMGLHSLDNLFGLTKISWFSSPATAWIVIGIAIVLAMLNLAARRPVKQDASDEG